MKKITIFIDLDDTLADTSQSIQKLFNYSAYIINHNPLKKSFAEILKTIKTSKDGEKLVGLLFTSTIKILRVSKNYSKS